ncbi:MAG: hypothetical protein U1D30_15280 [Planctomycetota bacterium]
MTVSLPRNAYRKNFSLNCHKLYSSIVNYCDAAKRESLRTREDAGENIEKVPVEFGECLAPGPKSAFRGE